jgi:hypothetical protein
MEPCECTLDQACLLHLQPPTQDTYIPPPVDWDSDYISWDDEE